MIQCLHVENAGFNLAMTDRLTAFQNTSLEPQPYSMCRGDSERDPLDAPGRTLSEFITYGTDSVARPLTSLAKQLAHRLLGSPEMTAELAMRRSVLSAPGAAQAQPHSASSFFNWLPASVWPLFKIVRGGQPAGEEQVSFTFLKRHLCMAEGASRASCLTAGWHACYPSVQALPCDGPAYHLQSCAHCA